MVSGSLHFFFSHNSVFVHCRTRSHENQEQASNDLLNFGTGEGNGIFLRSRVEDDGSVGLAFLRPGYDICRTCRSDMEARYPRPAIHDQRRCFATQSLKSLHASPFPFVPVSNLRASASASEKRSMFDASVWFSLMELTSPQWGGRRSGSMRRDRIRCKIISQARESRLIDRS